MRRRQALAVAAWLAAGGRAAAQAPGAMPRAVLAWGADGCWVGGAGGELHRLAGATAEVPPVPTAQGVWAVHEGGRGLHRWRADGGSGWGAVAEAVLREPVHALAASADGDWALIAHGERVSLLDAHGALVKSYEGTDLAGRRRGRASWLSALPQRRSFAVAWPALGELWELLLDPRAPPIHDGLVHDYRLNEAIAAPGYLGVRRAPLGEPLPAFGFADPRVPWVAGALGDEAVAVVHLDVRRRIATLDLSGMPHLGSGITWQHEGRTVMASTNLKQAIVTVIDTNSWKTVKHIPTAGPGFFLRSHERTPYAWVDAMMSPRRDTLQVIDKRTLSVAGEVRPAPGKTAAHVEFTRDGRYALVSVWEMDGALVVYDAQTLKEVKRLPMVKPVGKYNVHNKITRSEGTSH